MTATRHDRDAALIFVSAFVRSSTVGLVGVILAIYLAEIGLSAAAIGGVIGAELAGGAVATLLVGFRGDAFGRRRTLIALALSRALGYVALTVADHVVALVPLAFLGMLNGMRRDRGAASALEQALLPATTDDERRTWVLASYNVVLDTGHAAGALAGVASTLFVRLLHTGSIGAHRVTFLLCAGAIAASVAPYAVLSSRVEVGATRGLASRGRLAPRTRRAVRRLAELFGVDRLGGGFLSSAFIAYQRRSLDAQAFN